MIFLSYARADEAYAVALQRVLQAQMYSVWRDKDNLEPGDRYRQRIAEALAQSACVVVLWSKVSVVSSFVAAESERAFRDKKLIPVSVEECEPPVPFGELHAADLRTWDKKDLHHQQLMKLIGSISRFVQPGPLVAPSAAPQKLAIEDRTLPIVADTAPATAAFDEIYVISDIQMGGLPALQHMNQGQRLSRLVRHLAEVSPDCNVALIINGDLIDFSLEDYEGHAAIREAASIIHRVSQDPSFRPVWDELKHFLRTPRRHLIIISGSTDLELALPEASAALTQLLTASDPASRSRLTLITRSAGFRCNIGHANVLCKHGHDLDPWNMVDQRDLTRVIDALNEGRVISNHDWLPNGARLVVRQRIRQIQTKFPFLAFLKPEATVALPMLLALEPALLFRLPLEFCMQIVIMLSQQKVRSLGAVQGRRLLVGRVAQDSGFRFRPFVGILLLSNRAERLRRMLLGVIEKDTTFALDTLDDQAKTIAASVGDHFQFVVTGHTHLERAIPFEGGEGCYYNTGTWERLIRLNRPLLSDAKHFEETFRILASGDLTALDSATIPLEGGGTIPLVLQRPTVLRILSTPEGVVGELFHVFDEHSGSIRLEPLEASRFVSSQHHSGDRKNLESNGTKEQFGKPSLSLTNWRGIANSWVIDPITHLALVLLMLAAMLSLIPLLPILSPVLAVFGSYHAYREGKLIRGTVYLLLSSGILLAAYYAIQLLRD